MKSTVELPTEVFEEIRRRAVYFGREVEDAVAYYLEKGLAISPGLPTTGPSRIQTDAKTGLPVVIGSRNAPAREMSVDALVDLEHDTLTLDDLEHFRVPTGK